MKNFLSELRTAFLLAIIFAILLCGVYPLAVWAGGQALFPSKANGSLITDADGTVRGSALLGQSFTSDKYFNSRPSAAGVGYDATNSSGTNLSPTSQKLSDSIKAAVAAYRTSNNLSPDAPVPADAVTSSASGLDPHISLANAQLQAARVARIRNLSPTTVTALITTCTDDRDLHIFGEPGVNVLLLNHALDHLP